MHDNGDSGQLRGHGFSDFDYGWVLVVCGVLSYTERGDFCNPGMVLLWRIERH